MILLRHGQSTWNAIYGKSREDPYFPDPELTDIGHAQIEKAATQLARLDIRHMVVSPYRRTLQTAAIVNKVLNVPLSIDPRVRERNAFHCDIGSSPAQLTEWYPDLDFSGLADDWFGQPIETFEELDVRRAEFEDDWRQNDARHHTLVVCHWGYIRSASGVEVMNGEWLEHTIT